jgi:hypothetical protein
MAGGALPVEDGGVTAPLLRPVLALSSILLLAGCSDEPGVRRLRIAGSFDPAALDFGEVPLEMERTLDTTFKNSGEGLFTIQDVEITPGFSLVGVKTSLAGQSFQPGQELPLKLAFFPTAEGPLSGKLIIRGETVDAELPLSGIGALRRVPILAVEPSAVNFGSVAVDDVARATVVVRNTGNAAATLEQATLASTGAPFGANDPFLVTTPLPVEVPAGGSATLELAFRPRMEGAFGDIVNLLAAGVAGPVQVAVSGMGIIPLGDLLCEPTTVSFGQVERGQVGRRDVTCTARGGPARLISGVVDGNAMFVLPSPPATVDLANNQSVTVPVEFRADGLPSTQRGTLRLNYAGAAGAATARVELVGEVIPPPVTETAISINLSWNTNRTDVDLHLVRPGGRVFASDGSACYYRSTDPDWGRRGDTTDNPFLDRDDVDGFGPETINLADTAPGAYNVYVHYYGDRGLGASTPTVQLFLAGVAAGTFTRNGMRCDELWHVGTINWNGATGTFQSVNQVRLAGEGSCGF